jgi:hypothetical protein
VASPGMQPTRMVVSPAARKMQLRDARYRDDDVKALLSMQAARPLAPPSGRPAERTVSAAELEARRDALRASARHMPREVDE